MTDQTPAYALSDNRRLGEETTMTPSEAEALADRIFDAMTGAAGPRIPHVVRITDRDRIASDIEGLREHFEDGTHDFGGCGGECPDALRYAANLRRTATLYGVAP